MRFFAKKSLMIFSAKSTIEVIRELHQTVQECNPAFSAHAFAKKIGISQSYLSLVLSGKRPVTPRLASKISSSFNLFEVEKAYFELLVKKENAKGPGEREGIERKIEKLKRDFQIKEIDLISFEFLSEWHHSAVLECLNLPVRNDQITFFSRQLKISKEKVRVSLLLLKKLGFTRKENDRYIRIDSGYLKTPSEIKSIALRKFHQQIMNMGIAALNEETVARRNFSGITMSIDPKKIPEAKKRIQNFMEELMGFLESGERKEIYQLSTGLFELKNYQVEKN